MEGKRSEIVFSVSPVEKSQQPLDITTKLDLKAKLGVQPESSSHLQGNFVHNPYNFMYSSESALNSFVDAVGRAFSDHYTLVLSPDMIWLCIIQGFSFHVNNNAEELREKFVAHEGKKTLKVRRDDFVKGSAQNPWDEVFPEFTEQIKEHIGADTHDLILPRFSTTGPVERAACEIVLMEAMQSYFEYIFITECGIPEIALQGTTADWQRIRENAEKLSQYNLDWWIPHLLPVLDQFVAASKGNVDKPFWVDFYNYHSGSGSSDVSGWILVLFPYLGSSGKRRSVFPDKPGPFGRVSTDKFPSGLSLAPFTWKYYDLSFDMSFISGFMAVSQDPTTLAVKPEIGWAVTERKKEDGSDAGRLH